VRQSAHLGHVEEESAFVEGFGFYIEGEGADVGQGDKVVWPLEHAAEMGRHAGAVLCGVNVGEAGFVQPSLKVGLGLSAALCVFCLDNHHDGRLKARRDLANGAYGVRRAGCGLWVSLPSCPDTIGISPQLVENLPLRISKRVPHPLFKPAAAGTREPRP